MGDANYTIVSSVIMYRYFLNTKIVLYKWCKGGCRVYERDEGWDVFRHFYLILTFHVSSSAEVKNAWSYTSSSWHGA
jgi:hypothetical protein